MSPSSRSRSIAGAVLIPKANEEEEPALDLIGALLSIAGLGALVYAIIEAPTRGWLSGATMIAFAIAIVVLLAFAFWELRTSEPMLDLRFFRNPQFAAATSSITFVFFVMFGMIFTLTQYLQLVLGYGPLEAGVRMLPWALVYMVSARRSARVVQRFGQRTVVSSGLVVVAAGLALLARSGLHSNYAFLALSLVVSAAGMGMVTAPSTGAIIVSLPLNKAGVGSAVNDTTRELGGALGVAVLGSLIASLYRADLPASAQAASTSLGAGLEAAAKLPAPAGARARARGAARVRPRVRHHDVRRGRCRARRVGRHRRRAPARAPAPKRRSCSWARSPSTSPSPRFPPATEPGPALIGPRSTTYVTFLDRSRSRWP